MQPMVCPEAPERTAPVAGAEVEAVGVIPERIHSELEAEEEEPAARARPRSDPADTVGAARLECFSFRPDPRWHRIRSSSEPEAPVAPVAMRVPVRREEPAAREAPEVV
jgi:hypothetical protein